MSDTYFDERMETLAPDVLLKLRDHRLRWQFRRCWDGSPFYRARFEAVGLTPETFGGLNDLERLPLLSSGDLSELPSTVWQVAPDQWIVVRPDPAVSTPDIASRRSQTRGDLTHAADRAARARWGAGVRELPATGDERRAGPPYGRRGTVLSASTLNVAPVGDWAGYQCERSNGFHWVIDQLLPELLDSSGVREHPGMRSGELVVTDLVREASPFVRFRTGLEFIASDEPCPCGRTSLRLWPGGGTDGLISP